MALLDQLSYIERFLDHWKDLLLFYVNKLEVNGTFGYHQDKYNLFQLVKMQNNSHLKHLIHYYYKITV